MTDGHAGNVAIQYLREKDQLRGEQLEELLAGVLRV